MVQIQYEFVLRLSSQGQSHDIYTYRLSYIFVLAKDGNMYNTHNFSDLYRPQGTNLCSYPYRTAGKILDSYLCG
jgi:hypothetical protein